MVWLIDLEKVQCVASIVRWRDMAWHVAHAIPGAISVKDSDPGATMVVVLRQQVGGW